MAVDSEALADTRDIVYVICTLIQTIFGLLFIGYFWDKRKRKEDRKREDKQREEDRQKADADNLAAVLGQNFDKVERIFDRFDKKVVKLGEKKITHRFSEHDVLLHMCHPDNQETFATPNQSSHNTGYGMEMGMLAAPNQSNDTSTYGIKQVLSDVDSIMKLFIEIRLKLSLIHNKTGPEDIKDEFSSEIKKMGEAIYPFVSVPRQKVIKLALKYFDPELTHADQQERGTHTQPHAPTGSESQTHNSIPRPSDEGNTDAIPPSNNHPNSGPSEIKNEIPYIEFLQYKDGNIDYNIPFPYKYSNLQNLEELVRQGKTEIMRKNDEIQKRIRKVLDGHQVPEQQIASSNQIYLLHLIRIVMLKIHNEELDNIDEFIEYVQEVGCYPLAERLNLRLSERAVCDIEVLIYHLQNCHKVILGYKQTPQFLGNKAEEIRKFIEDQLQITQ